MIKKIKHMPPEYKMSLFLVLISVILMIFFKINFWELVRINRDIIIKIMYLTVMAVGISTAIHFLIPAHYVENHLEQNKIVYLFYATVLGILTPGPVYAIYPIILALKKKGINNAILVSYITGQTIVGPARVPFEVGLFGWDFFIYRIILSLFMGPLAGLIYISLSKILPDKES